MTPQRPALPTLPARDLHASALVRLLAQQALLHPPAQRAPLGDQLAQWLDFRQAIALHALLEPTGRAAAPAARRPRRPDMAELREDLNDTRRRLQDAILHGHPPGPGLPRLDWPTEAPDPELPPRAAFDPWMRHLQAHQRQMSQHLRPLRERLRRALADSGSAGARLVALDAAFEQVLDEREQRLLARLPVLLQKIMLRLWQQSLAPAQVLSALHDPLRQLLLAELDWRLQTHQGLLAACQEQHDRS